MKERAFLPKHYIDTSDENRSTKDLEMIDEFSENGSFMPPPAAIHLAKPKHPEASLQDKLAHNKWLARQASPPRPPQQTHEPEAVDWPDQWPVRTALQRKRDQLKEQKVTCQHKEQTSDELTGKEPNPPPLDSPITFLKRGSGEGMDISLPSSLQKVEFSRSSKVRSDGSGRQPLEVASREQSDGSAGLELERLRRRGA